MNHQAIITDGCDSLARSTSFKAALMAILLVKQLTIDLPERDNNIWIILHLLSVANHESRGGLLYRGWSRGHWTLELGLVELYRKRPQAHWALGPELEIQRLTPSPLDLRP